MEAAEPLLHVEHFSEPLSRLAFFIPNIRSKHKLKAEQLPFQRCVTVSDWHQDTTRVCVMPPSGQEQRGEKNKSTAIQLIGSGCSAGQMTEM